MTVTIPTARGAYVIRLGRRGVRITDFVGCRPRPAWACDAIGEAS